jgi:glycosyltransferase involved in cell wall biosynthesis
MRKYDIGYFSSADRGLDVLLELIPTIEERLGRKVTSCWAYGFNTFDKFHAQNPTKMKWKWEVIRAMSKVGTFNAGRISHEALSDLMRDTKVLVYPTSFPEIDCITVKKAQAAGMDVVTSGYAALQTSVLKEEPDIELIHEKPEELDKFVNRVVEALKNPISEQERQDLSKKAVDVFNWEGVAAVWDKELS